MNVSASKACSCFCWYALHLHGGNGRPRQMSCLGELYSCVQATERNFGIITVHLWMSARPPLCGFKRRARNAPRFMFIAARAVRIDLCSSISFEFCTTRKHINCSASTQNIFLWEYAEGFNGLLLDRRYKQIHDCTAKRCLSRSCTIILTISTFRQTATRYCAHWIVSTLFHNLTSTSSCAVHCSSHRQDFNFVQCQHTYKGQENAGPAAQKPRQ